MNGRQRVWAALQGKLRGRPPKGEILIAPEIIHSLGCSDLENALALLNADLVTLEIDADGTLPDGGAKVWADSGYFVFALLPGAFSPLIDHLGWPGLAKLLHKQPAEARRLIERLLQERVRLVGNALDAGCHGILIADDLAGNQGPLVSPTFLAKAYFPPLASLLHEAGCREIPFLFHSDGDVRSLISHLKEAGFWGIQGLQPSSNISPDDFSQQALKRWVFWGNFEFEGPASLKRTTQVQAEVDALLDKWNDFPGYIFGSSGGLYPGLLPAPVKTAYATVDRWEQGGP